MKPWSAVAALAVALLATDISTVGQVWSSSAGLQAGEDGQEAAGLKLIKSPIATYPDEALKKQIQGSVTLRIVVDEKGRVSDAKALSGPLELRQAAVDSVKRWEFEPPAKAPVVATAEVGYGFPRKCPNAVSTAGQVLYSMRLKNQRGTYVDVVDNEKNPMVMYPNEDRKSGAAGEMVLALTIGPEGKVAKVWVLKSVSPNLDKLVMETVRGWTVKAQPGTDPSPSDEFALHIWFTPTCDPSF
jgi:TonB family protein